METISPFVAADPMTAATTTTTPAVVIIPDVLKENVTREESTADTISLADETVSLLSSVAEAESSSSSCFQVTVTAPETTTVEKSSSRFKVHAWDGKALFSDLIQQGLVYQNKKSDHVVMLFENPTSASSSSTFYNSQVYKFHDYPHVEAPWKAILGPCRYSLMNGSCYPSYLQGQPPDGLMEHWKVTIPHFVEPSFVSTIDEDSQVYAYLPMEHISNHLNDPHVHYHLAGKDAIGLMTQKTTKRYTNTQDIRPCICKTTHSMASKGIFVIRNDDDEQQFSAFLAESGNPTFIVTEFVNIARNVACHFFIHPNGEITWFGSNENHKNKDGDWSSDSHIVLSEQDSLRDLQLPFVRDVVEYCHALGFWGSCGVDILVDENGQGYLVDVNPRVTGSCPAIMTSLLLKQEYGFEFCLFRRSPKFAFPGSAEELLTQVELYNRQNHGTMMIVLYSFYEVSPTETIVNIGVHGGKNMEECESVLNMFTSLKDI